MSKTRDLADSAEVINFLDGVTSNIQTQITSNSDSLSTVATTGSYNDLSDLPTIPVDVSELTDTTQLLTHFDGDYNSLTNTPAIPSLTGYATETYVDTAVGAINPDPTKATLSKTFLENESYLLTLSEPITSGCPVVSVTKEIPQTGVTNNSWDVNSTTENYTRLDSAYGTTLSFTGGGSPFVLGTGSFASADVGKTIEANSGEFVLTATDGSFIETTAPTSYDQVASGDWGMYGVIYNAADGDLQLSSYIPAIENLLDADGWTYNNSSFTLSGQDTSPTNLFFKPDGTKMYVAGFQNNRIHQYTLSTAWDLSTASYDSVFLQTNQIAAISLLIDANISTNGDRIYALDYSTSNSIHEFSLSTPWDLSTATYTNRSIVVPESASYCFEMKPDGTLLFIWNSATHVIHQAILSTPWDISTASFVSSYGPVAEATETYGMLLNTAGTKMWLTDFNTNTILQYSLSTPWDVTTITYDSVFLQTNAVTGGSQMIGIALSTDESKGYLLNYNSDILYEYNTTGTGPSFILTGYHPVHTKASIDSTYWTDINSMTADQDAGDGNVYYAISTDDRTTWTVIDNTEGERDIVRNNGGTWQYNSNGTYASETWTNGTTNTELATLAEAMETAQNRMDKTQLDAVTDPNHIALGNDLDLAIVFNMTSGTTVPSSDGVAINYDGTVLNKGAVLGTDYDFDIPAQDKVRVTALNAGNYKVRIV
jgi:hypothetical protein